MFGLNLFKRDKRSEESEFRDIYYSLINGVFDMRKIPHDRPLCFVYDLPIKDINTDFIYVLVRGSHPYYTLKYYYFDSDNRVWLELEV